jgi:hypothetical protein
MSYAVRVHEDTTTQLKVHRRSASCAPEYRVTPSNPSGDGFNFTASNCKYVTY